MIGFAPITRLVDWFTTDEAWREIRKYVGSELGAKAIEVALEEIGNGEFGGNNRGKHLDRYRSGFGGQGAWCAAFVCYCIEEATRRLGIKCPIKRTHSARKLFQRVVAAGWLVKPEHVRVGDVVLWPRGKSWQGHVGIVSAVYYDKEGRVADWYYIAGNEGKYPAPVLEREGKSKSKPIGFARLS